MKKTILFLLVTFSFQLSAQNNWFKNFGSTKFEYLDRVATDDSNNVYVAGRMGANMTIGDTTLVKINFSSSYNYFVVKFTEAGKFVWGLNIDVPAGIDQVSGLAADKLGYVYMAIEKPGMLYKINPNGTFAIQKTIQAWNARLANIEIDNDLNIWIGGSFSQYNFSFDGLPAMPHLNGTGMYIAKLDSSLTAKQVIPIGSNSLSSRIGKIALKDSLVYVCTNSDNSVYIANDTIKDARIITACFGKNGNYKWAKAAYLNETLTGIQHVWDIAVSDSHQVVIVGEFYEPMKIGTTVLANANNKENFFMASYNKDGSLLWARQSSTIYSSGNSVKFINTEKLAIIADYSFGFTLGGKSGGDGVSNKRYPLYISANKNGTVDWIKTLGQKDWAYANDLAIDKKGNWYLGGNFQATTTNTIDGNTVSVVGESDVYILKNFMVAEPTIGATTFCNDNLPKSLVATGTNVNWFADSLATVLVFEGNNLTVNLTNDSVFYVQQSFGHVNSKPKAVMVKINQLKPVKLTQSGNTLTVQPAIGKSYQWFNNGALISGVNSATLFATINGKYHVIATDSNNCKNYTDTINFVSNSLNEIISHQVNVYPNPNNGNFTLEFLKEGNYKIINQLGQEIAHFQYVKNIGNTLIMSNLQDGIYYIVSENNQNLGRQKIVVIH